MGLGDAVSTVVVGGFWTLMGGLVSELLVPSVMSVAVRVCARRRRRSSARGARRRCPQSRRAAGRRGCRWRPRGGLHPLAATPQRGRVAVDPDHGALRPHKVGAEERDVADAAPDVEDAHAWADSRGVREARGAGAEEPGPLVKAFALLGAVLHWRDGSTSSPSMIPRPLFEQRGVASSRGIAGRRMRLAPIPATTPATCETTRRSARHPQEAPPR